MTIPNRRTLDPGTHEFSKLIHLKLNQFCFFSCHFFLYKTWTLFQRFGGWKLVVFHLPSPKLTTPLKIVLPKRQVFQQSIFRCYVSFREGRCLVFFYIAVTCPNSWLMTAHDIMPSIVQMAEPFLHCARRSCVRISSGRGQPRWAEVSRSLLKLLKSY